MSLWLGETGSPPESGEMKMFEQGDTVEWLMSNGNLMVDHVLMIVNDNGWDLVTTCTGYTVPADTLTLVDKFEM